MKNGIAIALVLLLVFSNHVLAQKMIVKDSDSNVLMEVNDEGTMGSITLPDTNVTLSSETNKLYNLNGSLIWNGSVLGTAGSAGGWTDGGSVVHLSNGTDKVGIGDLSPTNNIDITGTIGISDTQVVYLPDQTVFPGSFFLGTGGSHLQYTTVNDGIRNTAVGLEALKLNTI